MPTFWSWSPGRSRRSSATTAELPGIYVSASGVGRPPSRMAATIAIAIAPAATPRAMSQRPRDAPTPDEATAGPTDGAGSADAGSASEGCAPSTGPIGSLALPASAPGRPLPRIPDSCFITRCISVNCFTSRFTSVSEVPEPIAIRRRRDPVRIAGSRRSASVIARMIASVFFRSPRSTASWASFAIEPMPGIIDTSWPIGPIFLTCWSWSSMSSRVNSFFRSLASSFTADSTSTCSWARSTRVRTSPMPRIRPASRSGWKTSNASLFSPVPRNLTPRPLTAAIESAAPPRASPSIFVRTRPVTGTAAANAWATVTDSWPVIASTTSSVSTGWVAASTARISAMSASSIVSRPAVSRMTVSRVRRFAASMAPRAISTTGVPAGARCTGMSSALPSVWSCSEAAGRYGSAATRSGRRPSLTMWRASFAAVVVLPEPWSPTSEMTAGLP